MFKLKKSLVISLCIFFAFEFVEPEEIDQCNSTCSNNISGNILLYQSTCFCTECSLHTDCCRDMQNKNQNTIDYNCNIKISENEMIYSISRCPIWWSQQPIHLNIKIQQLCENHNADYISDNSSKILIQVPVFNQVKNITFKNLFCARCNLDKFQVNDIEFFKLKLSVKNLIKYGSEITKEMAEEILLEYDENRVFKPPESVPSIRKCFPVIQDCPEKNETVHKKLCSGYTAMVYNQVTNKIYRNKYCAYCHNETSSNLKCHYTKNHEKRASLQILFDVSNLFSERRLNDVLVINKISLEEKEGGDFKLPTDESQKEDVSEIIKKYMTIIGILVSITSIIALLIIYMTNEALRNFPGKLLICLSVSILFSQVSFLVSTYITEPKVVQEINSVENFNDVKKIFEEMFNPCYIFGCLTHFFHIASFTWTNIMGFDLYRMFSKLMSSSVNSENQDSRNKRFKKYSIYGWLIPLLLVLVPIGKQFISSEISYGVKRCFLSTKIDALIFFIVPFAFVLFANLIFLIITIWSIMKVDKMTNNVLNKKKIEVNIIETKDVNIKKNIKEKFNKKIHSINIFKSEKKRFSLFVKLFLLTGMTGFFGLIASTDGNSIFWYVFIGLNSLQGLFIFFSFAFNSQTRHELSKNKTLLALSGIVSNSNRVKSSLTQSSVARSN